MIRLGTWIGWLLLCAPLAVAQTNSNGQFIIALDTSFSMARKREAAFQMVRSLIESGFNHAIRPGESLQIWTFNDKVHRDGRPALKWREEEKQFLAQQAASLLQRQQFFRHTRMDRLIDELKQNMATSGFTAIYLISDAEERIQGTPFDAHINSVYEKYQREGKQQDKPLLTALYGENGQLLSWGIFTSAEGSSNFARNARGLQPVEAPALRGTSIAPLDLLSTRPVAYLPSVETNLYFKSLLRAPTNKPDIYKEDSVQSSTFDAGLATHTGQVGAIFSPVSAPVATPSAGLASAEQSSLLRILGLSLISLVLIAAAAFARQRNAEDAPAKSLISKSLEEKSK